MNSIPLNKSIAGIGLLAIAGVSSCGLIEKNSKRPNILFIMSDDHAYQAISSYGSELIETPNIDRLANNGVRFTQSFCTNSICAPSRAVLLTGKYSHINGHIDNSKTFDGSQQTFPKLLQQAGYQTAVIGKWHLKSDPTGFDYWNILPGQGHYYNPDFIEMGERKRVEGYVTDLITDKSLDWLDNRDKEKPFCLLLHHKAPHRSWKPDLKYLEEYSTKEFPIPDNFYDNYEKRIAAQRQELSVIYDMSMDYDLKLPSSIVRQDYPDIEKVFGNKWGSISSRMTSEQKEKWDYFYNKRAEEYTNTKFTENELKEWKLQQYLKDYLACIASVDDNVGRVLDYLEKNGLRENTIVIYTSDQGFYLGEHGWFDKRFMYEESFRMPLIISYPDRIKSRVDNNHMVMNLDFAPTFLDYAGIEIPEDIQGKSMKRLLEKKSDKEWRDAVYYHYYEYAGGHRVMPHYGIRTDRYKLIRFYYATDKYELYDLQEDPSEMNNLYGDPEYAVIQSQMTQKLFDIQKEYKDTDLKKFWPPEAKKVNHIAKNASYKLTYSNSEKYKGSNEYALTDGLMIPAGDWHQTVYTNFVGFEGSDLEMIIDLKKTTDIKSIAAGFLQNQNDWIFFPKKIKYQISKNGRNFREVFSQEIDACKQDNFMVKKQFRAALGSENCRYIKIIAENIKYCPEWHPGSGEKSWIFADEVIVR